MPRKSLKRKFQDFIELDGYVGVLFSKNDKELDEEIEYTLECMEKILTTRYVAERTKVLKSLDWFNVILPSYDNDRFKFELRVSREEFNYVLG